VALEAGFGDGAARGEGDDGDDEAVEGCVGGFGARRGDAGGGEDGGGAEAGGEGGGEDVGVRGGGGGLRALGGALLGDCDFFFLGEFGEFHAEGGAEVVVCGGEDVFELAAGVGGHYWGSGCQCQSITSLLIEVEAPTDLWR